MGYPTCLSQLASFAGSNLVAVKLRDIQTCMRSMWEAARGAAVAHFPHASKQCSPLCLQGEGEKGFGLSVYLEGTL